MWFGQIFKSHTLYLADSLNDKTSLKSFYVSYELAEFGRVLNPRLHRLSNLKCAYLNAKAILVNDYEDMFAGLKSIHIFDYDNPDQGFEQSLQGFAPQLVKDGAQVGLWEVKSD